VGCVGCVGVRGVGSIRVLEYFGGGFFGVVVVADLQIDRGGYDG